MPRERARRCRRRRCRELFHLERPPHAANLILERVEADDLGQHPLHLIVGREERVLNQLQFLLLVPNRVGAVERGLVGIDAPALLLARPPHLMQQRLHVRDAMRVHPGRKERVGVSVLDLHEDGEDGLEVFLHVVVALHGPLELLLHPLAPGLGGLEDFVVGRGDGLALQQGHDVGRCPVRNGQVEGRVRVVVLLVRAFGVGGIERLHHFQRGVVVRGVVQGEVAVVVLLGGALGEDLEEEALDVERALLPGGEVQSEVAVVVGDGGCLGVGLEEGLGDLDGGAEGCGGVQGEIAAVVFDACFVSCGGVGGAGDGGLPALRELV